MLSEMTPSALLLAANPETAASSAPKMLMRLSPACQSVGFRKGRVHRDELAQRNRHAIDGERCGAVLDTDRLDRADRGDARRDRTAGRADGLDLQRVVAVRQLHACVGLSVPGEGMHAGAAVAWLRVDNLAARVDDRQRR